MKGDFSRRTFNAQKHYSAVLMQQGRVQVDADWNEQQAINQHRLETSAKDVIGKCGVPEAEDGFAITWQCHELYDLCFVGKQKGWLVGDRGTIWVTADSGNTWTEQQSGVIQDLHGVYFVDRDRGWVVGQKGTILVTINGGETWTQQTSNVHNDLNDVYFADNSQGWAVGDKGTILATVNGGIDWQLQKVPENTSNLNSVYFVNANKGWAVGDKGTILVFTRNGEQVTWSKQDSPVQKNLNSVYFVSENQGWVVGEKASDNKVTILATSDGGKTWSRQGTNVNKNSKNLNSAYFIDANTGWVVGDNGKTLYTMDGGQNWQSPKQKAPDNTGNLNSVYFVDTIIGWAVVSSKGKFLTYQNNNWSAPKQLYDFEISKGRIYVDGILCENEESILFAHQLDFPGATLPKEPTSPQDPQSYLFYLDVWQRYITPLDDPQIQEVALGGADTATRTKIIWQVKAEPIDDQSCSSTLPDWKLSKGKLKARTTPPEPSTDLCKLPPTTGYKRLENQLYRVEIHRGGELKEGSANLVTFKWSRENGSVVTAIEKIDGSKLIVADLGKDEVLGFASNQWVEVLDDRLELNGEPGHLALITTIDPDTREITLNEPPNAIDMTRHAKLRRWDQLNPRKRSDVTADGVSITPSTWIPLEEGIEVWFSSETDTKTYKTGDYWLIPARTATAEIEWPPYDPEQEPIAQLPLGIEHHYCCLAIATFNDKTKTWDIKDCRPLFSSLTELSEPSLFYVGGDGQEVMPVPAAQAPQLPQPLQVRVARWANPVDGTKVKFTIEKGTGELSKDKQNWTSNPLEVETGDDGIAKCYWKLEPNTDFQQVKAELVDENNTLPIYFSANLSVASQVAYQAGPKCIALEDTKTVQDAIDKLCGVYQPHRLNQLAFGLAVGLGFALYIILTCLFVLFSKMGELNNFSFFQDVLCCIPQESSFSVCVMRAITNFFIGFVLGWLVAYCYNKISFSANQS